jgi:hypothetical protein
MPPVARSALMPPVARDDAARDLGLSEEQV